MLAQATVARCARAVSQSATGGARGRRGGMPRDARRPRVRDAAHLRDSPRAVNCARRAQHRCGFEPTSTPPTQRRGPRIGATHEETTLKLCNHLSAALLALAACHAQAQSDDALRNDAKTTGDVLTYGMGYNNQRYSPLKQINTGNVAKLVPVWAYSLNNTQSHESQPIVHDGVMYVTTHNATMAINAMTGKQIWKTEVELPQDVFKYACCGILNRGAAIYNGKVYRTTLDAQVVALDAKTGKQIWKSKAADYQDGHAQTGAPLVVNGAVMTGIAGGEYGTRGFIDGWDANDGHKLWRLYTTAASGEKGGDTWPGDTAQKGGAPTRLTGAYDPELDLVYWGTGNGGPGKARAGKGDNPSA